MANVYVLFALLLLLLLHVARRIGKAGLNLGATPGAPMGCSAHLAPTPMWNNVVRALLGCNLGRFLATARRCGPASFRSGLCKLLLALHTLWRGKTKDIRKEQVQQKMVVPHAPLNRSDDRVVVVSTVAAIVNVTLTILTVIVVAIIIALVALTATFARLAYTSSSNRYFLPMPFTYKKLIGL